MSMNKRKHVHMSIMIMYREGILRVHILSVCWNAMTYDQPNHPSISSKDRASCLSRKALTSFKAAGSACGRRVCFLNGPSFPPHCNLGMSWNERLMKGLGKTYERLRMFGFHIAPHAPHIVPACRLTPLISEMSCKSPSVSSFLGQDLGKPTGDVCKNAGFPWPFPSAPTHWEILWLEARDCALIESYWLPPVWFSCSLNSTWFMHIHPLQHIYNYI